jgi:MFS family permease
LPRNSRDPNGCVCALNRTADETSVGVADLEAKIRETVATPKRNRLASFLSLERNIGAASGAVFLLGLGEELWKKFLPKYLESLGASVPVIGLFGTAEDFFDAIYQYPGGWLADHWGRRKALLSFIVAAWAGYLIYFFSPSWPFLFLGLSFVMVWQSMGSPAIFATIADALPIQQRGMGFTIYSILKRIPMVVSPLIGGVILGALGIRAGMRVGLGITLIMALVAVPLLLTMNLPIAGGDTVRIQGVWKSFDPILRRLLVSDIAIRTCEGMADVFTILYVTNVIGIPLARYGILVAVQLATAILVYIPSAKLAERVGRRPVVIATFLCFALYPVAIVMAKNFTSLLGAFVLGGLREIGEPSRKAMIVDLAAHEFRARTVGLYYLLRSLSITPASAVGGVLWKIRPPVPFLTAGVIGIIGTVLFAFTVDGESDGPRRA